MNWQMKQCVMNNSNLFSVKLEFDIKLIFPIKCLFIDDSNLFIAYNESMFCEAFKCCCCDNGVLPGL